MAITRLQSPKDYIRIWFLWKRQAITVLGLIVLSVMVYAYWANPVYESNAELMIMPRTMEGEVITTGNDERRVVPVTENDIYTEVELITSQPVLAGTITSLTQDQISLSDPGESVFSLILLPVKNAVKKITRALKPSSDNGPDLEAQVAALKKALVLSPVVESNIVEVSLHGEVAPNTLTLLKTLLENYFQHRSNIFAQEKGLHFFSDQAREFKLKLDDAEKKLKAFELTENIYNLDEQIRADIALISKLTDELKMTEITFAGDQARTSMLKGKMTDNPDMVNLSKEMRDIPAIRELEKGLVPVLIERSAVSGRFSKESRQYKNIDGQIKMLRDEIRYEVENALYTDQLELESTAVRIESLKAKIAELRADVNELNQKGRTFDELSRKVEIYKNNFELYEGKTEDAKVLNRKSKRKLANVCVSSDPTLLEQPIAPKRLTLLMLALGAGFVAAVFLPFVLESIDNKLKSADDVQVLIDLPVICSFNEIKD